MTLRGSSRWLHQRGGLISRQRYLPFCVRLASREYRDQAGTGAAPGRSRRLQWLLAGCGVGLTPVLMFALFQSVLNIRLPLWFIVSALLLIILFPLTLGYVIVVQRAMNVRIALRIGVQYTLARGGITAARVCLTALIIFFMYRLTKSSDNALWADFAIGVCVALLFLFTEVGRR